MKYPLWFWIAIILFMLGQWAAIPVLAISIDHARDVMKGILIISVIFYPLFVLTMCILIKRTSALQLNSKKWFLTLLLLAVPILLYFPFWFYVGSEWLKII